MSKKAGKSAKKSVLIWIGISLLIIGLGGSSAFLLWKQQQDRQQAEKIKAQAVVEAREELDKVAFRGDRDVATQYLERIKANDPEGALQMYEQAATSKDTNGKILLYRSAFSAASQAKQADHRLKFLLILSDLEPGYRVYGALAELYASRNDTPREIEYWQKSVDAINGMPHDSEVYTSLLTIYQDNLKRAQEKQ